MSSRRWMAEREGTRRSDVSPYMTMAALTDGHFASGDDRLKNQFESAFSRLWIAPCLSASLTEE